MPVIPYYGRDYKNAKEATEAWERGDDFILADISSRWHGKPCSGRDFEYQSMEIRYNKLSRLTFAIYYPKGD